MARSASINLVRKTEREWIDRFLEWALGPGKLIVYVTFFIVLSALIYRVFLDRQIIDLHEKIDQKKAFLASLQQNEAKFRSLQEKIQTVAIITKNVDKQVTVFTSVFDNVRTDITFGPIAISDDSMSFTTTVNSVSILTEFIQQLKTNSNIKKISLNKVENQLSQGKIVTNFTLEL